jgi:hypothetical protein
LTPAVIGCITPLIAASAHIGMQLERSSSEHPLLAASYVRERR